MKSILFALMMLPGLAMAFSPIDALKALPGATEGPVQQCRFNPTDENEKPSYCFDLIFQGAVYRLVTHEPSPAAEVYRVFTPKREEFPEGTVDLETFEALMNLPTGEIDSSKRDKVG